MPPKTNEEIAGRLAFLWMNEKQTQGEFMEEILSALTEKDKQKEEAIAEAKERIFGEIEQFKSEVTTMDYGDDFKDGIYATIEHILSLPLFESVLTPPTQLT